MSKACGAFSTWPVGASGGNLAGRDADGLRRADEFAELAGDAFLAAVRILHERGHAAVAGRNRGALLGILQRDVRREEVLERGLQPARDLREVGALGEGERFAFERDDGHGAKD